MKKVTSVHIGGKVITIEDSAYDQLQSYIEALRAQLVGESGENIDGQCNALESKIAEILSDKLSRGQASITEADIQELAHAKPTPADFSNAKTISTRRLHRDANDKILGGVCSGIAHFFNIDPTFVRLAAAIFALSGWGILIYLLFWIIIPAKELEPYAGKRIHRNNDNRIIAGVASGIAEYFNIDATIVRLIFVAPFVLNLIFGAITWPFFAFGFWFPGFIFGSLVGPFIVTYVVLWIVLPVSSKSASVSSPNTSAANSTRHSGIGQALGLLVKLFFIFIAAMIALSLFASLSAFSFVGLSLWPLTEFLWSSPWQQIFFVGTIVLFLGVPLIGLFVWLIRRIFGVRHKSNALSWIFGLLWTIGWIAAVFFIASIARDLRYYESGPAVDVPISAQPANGKLVVDVSAPELRFTEHYWWIDSDSSTGWDLSDDELKLSFVKIKVMPSFDSQYHAFIKKFSAGKSRSDARRRAEQVVYNATYANGVLDLGNGFDVSKENKFRGQTVEVDVSVPVGKKIRFEEAVKEKLNPVNITIENRKGFKKGFIAISSNDDDGFKWETNTDYIMGPDGELTLVK